jgi:hypothetical protein
MEITSKTNSSTKSGKVINRTSTRKTLINEIGNLIVAPRDISMASIKDLCLYIKGTGLLNLR